VQFDVGLVVNQGMANPNMLNHQAGENKVFIFPRYVLIDADATLTLH